MVAYHVPSQETPISHPSSMSEQTLASVVLPWLAIMNSASLNSGQRTSAHGRRGLSRTAPACRRRCLPGRESTGGQRQRRKSSGFILVCRLEADAPSRRLQRCARGNAALLSGQNGRSKTPRSKTTMRTGGMPTFVFQKKRSEEETVFVKFDALCSVLYAAFDFGYSIIYKSILHII